MTHPVGVELPLELRDFEQPLTQPGRGERAVRRQHRSQRADHAAGQAGKDQAGGEQEDDRRTGRRPS